MSSVPSSQISREYSSTLANYLGGMDGEEALLRAYEIGRASVGTGFGLLDMLTTHREATAGALTRAASVEEATRIWGVATSMLLEGLAPFEMAYRGFREANEQLAVLNRTLEQQVSEKTEELRASLERLQLADADRRRLLARLVTAQEEERKHIASDIHDDSIQKISALVMRLDMLCRSHPELEDLEQISKLVGIARESVGSLRRLVFRLRPETLDREGLASALREHLSQGWSDEDAPAYRVENRLSSEPPDQIRVVLFRVALEALANVRKHAQASRVDVLVAEGDGGYLVRVRDDGAGFAAKRGALSPPGHLGLTDMRERTELAGGWLRIESAPGRGTTVEFFLPAAGSDTLVPDTKG